MGQIGGDEVNISLDLVHHSIHVGHVASVLHAGAPMSADHMVNLFLELDQCPLLNIVFLNRNYVQFVNL